MAVDSNALGELSERALYDLLFIHLTEEAQQQELAQNVLAQIQALHQEVISLTDGLAWQKAFTRALQAVMAAPTRRLVFLFDQFDEVYKTIAPRFFAKLRSIRDTFKYRVSYITFTREELPYLSNAPECEEFYELLQPHVLGLGPYNREDSWTELRRIAARYGVTPEPTLGEQLIHLAGGHPGLLKAAFMSTLRPDRDLPSSEENAITLLLANNDVVTECAKLWGSLRDDERGALRTIAQGSKLPQDIDVLRRLNLKGLIVNEHQLFSPLFAEYINELSGSQSIETRIQAGPIRIDAAGDVWIETRKIVPPLTASEQRLLTHLCAKAGQLCSKDEIVAAVNIASDEALTALVERLRKRVERTPSQPGFILTIRGKGYMLKVG
jgi:hypothetical protein